MVALQFVSSLFAQHSASVDEVARIAVPANTTPSGKRLKFWNYHDRFDIAVK